MNAQTNNRIALGDILEQYAAEGPSYDLLNDYVRRYPQYRDELADFTVQWSAMEHAGIVEAADDAPAVEAGLAVVRSLLRPDTMTELSPEAEADALEAETFEDTLVALGIDLFDFEERSGLGYSLLINLSMGKSSFASPEERRCVARGLLRHICTFGPDSVPSVSAIERGISGPPRLAAGASSSQEQKPVATTKPFRLAIQDARDMTPEAKEEWLQLIDEAC